MSNPHDRLGVPRALTILLLCPSCEDLRVVRRHYTDPKRATRVVFQCHSCDPMYRKMPVLYFDQHGREVSPDEAIAPR